MSVVVIFHLPFPLLLHVCSLVDIHTFIFSIILEFFFATLALYTCVLLVTLHAQFRQDLKTSDDPRHHDEYYIVSYYEIMERYVGKWLKYFSMAVVLFALVGLSTVQMVAGGSNMYVCILSSIEIVIDIDRRTT